MYGKLFVCHKTNNLPKCEQFFKGLLNNCKSNIERMTEHRHADDNHQRQRFISKSP